MTSALRNVEGKCTSSCIVNPNSDRIWLDPKQTDADFREFVMFNIGSEKIARFLPNRLITTSGKKGDRILYLTFDDGPHPEFTAPVRDLLDSYSIKGSFFCIGKNLEMQQDLANSLVRNGHLIANHSHTHNRFSTLSISNRIEEIERCQACIQKLDQQALKIFRAPQGKLDPLLMLRLVATAWRIVHWSYDSLDYRKRSLSDQLDVFRSRPVKDGEILLFHDDNKLAVELLEVLIPEWLEQGFQFKTVNYL